MKQEHLIHLLRRAARTGDAGKIAQLVRAGADLNHVEKDGFYNQTTMLHVAVASPLSSAANLRRMIELGANPNLVCAQSGGTPLLVAAQLHALDKLSVLREAGANIHHLSKAGMNMTVCAAYGPAATLAQALQLTVDWGISLDTESEHGESALSVLSRRGLFNSIQFLLQHGADSRPLGWTALHYQAAGVTPTKPEHDEASSDDLEAKDRWGRTPLHVAALAGNLDALDRLLGRKANPKAQWRCASNALHAAAMTNQREVISKLLDLGLEPDWPDEFGTTPLMNALESDALDAVKVLLEAGAKLDAENAVQDRPVHFAKIIPAFELLQTRGCDLNVISGQGLWPLHEAAESGNVALVIWLLNHGARVDLTSTGETALHAAVRSDNLATVTALLDAGARPNAQDVDGWTPLFCLRSPEVARLLLDRGADPTASDQCDSSADRWIEDPEILNELKTKFWNKK